MKTLIRSIALSVALATSGLLSHGQICSPAINQQANPQISGAQQNLSMTQGQVTPISLQFANTGDPDVVPPNTLEIIISLPDAINMQFVPPYLQAGSGCGVWTVDLASSGPDAIVLHNTAGTTADGGGCLLQFLVQALTVNTTVTYSAAVNRTNPSCVGDADPSAANNTKSGSLMASVSLPVSFSAFTAQKQGCAAQLDWTTAMEHNNAHFNVERSSDGLSFAKIAQVEAAGNSSTEQRYTYMDRKPATGRNNYRITQVDVDGKNTSTAVKSLELDCGKDAGIKVYPTITDGTVYVSLPEGYEKATLSVFNILSQQINLSSTNNDQRLRTIQLNGLIAGTYFIRITNGNNIESHKIIYKP